MNYEHVTINGKRFLTHRLIWELLYGPIPEGHVVHHKDEDKRNNHPDNLELMEHGEHMAHHAAERGTDMTYVRAGHKPTPYVCTQCGIDYISKQAKPKAKNHFCSTRCCDSYRNARRSA